MLVSKHNCFDRYNLGGIDQYKIKLQSHVANYYVIIFQFANIIEAEFL